MKVVRSIPRAKRGASYSGRVMIDTVRGVLRVRKWPRKRGKPTSKDQLFWIDWFRQANYLAKYIDAASMIRARIMSEGSGLYPRDIILMAMRGRLYTWVDENGWRWYPVAAIQDISESLDVLAQTIGSVLVRAADRWRAPDLGAVDDVLTYKGEADPPVWQPMLHPGSWRAGALLLKDANQLIPTGVTTILSWETAVYQTAPIHSRIPNPSRLTVPIGFTRIQLSTNITIQANAGGRRTVVWFKNGAIFPGAPSTIILPGLALPWTINLASTLLEVVPGDYFEVAVLFTPGVALNVQVSSTTWASLQLIE